jgi:hypothetical protein
MEVDGGRKELQILVNRLATKAMRLEDENKDLRGRIEQAEKKLEGIEKYVNEALKMK